MITEEKAKEIIAYIGNATNERFDAGETAFLTRALLQVETQTYDVRYPQLKARELIPVSNELDPGAEQYSYGQYDLYGMAKIVANYANDFPRVDVILREFIANIKSLGDSYAYTIQDLRRAAFAGRNGVGGGGYRLDAERAKAARMAIERAIDDIAAVGNADAGLQGFANHVNVPVFAAPNGNWATQTPANIIADINAFVQSMLTLTKNTEQPTDLILPTNAFATLSQQPYSPYTATTTLAWFEANSPYITNVDTWYKLDTANAAGTGGRAVLYRKDPGVVKLHIPQEFEQFSPEQQSLQFKIPCHARIGGVQVTYPLAMAFMDGI